MAVLVLLLVVILVAAILLTATRPLDADHAGLRFREGQAVSPVESPAIPRLRPRQ